MTWILKVENYNLKRTLFSGQVFRWRRVGTGFVGVLANSVVRLTQKRNGIEAEIIHGKLSRTALCQYLNLNYDYRGMLEVASQDHNFKKAMKSTLGYRILRQDPYETLITFLDSSANTIVNIRKVVERICRKYGNNLGGEYYSFPAPEIIARLKPADLADTKAGFRAKYMIEASKVVQGENTLERIAKLDSNSAHRELIRLPGVGDKIADCILLFAYNRYDRVPIDTWTRKVFCRLYGCSVKDDYESMQKLAKSVHGDRGGYVFSMLFEAMRLGLL